jgi:hypothetical protein
MISLWIIAGLIIAAVSVSSIGATFSVIGIAALFSGAALTIAFMAGSLEFAKFVLAAYLHQRWNHLNRIFKYYLTSAIVVLSVITSMGIYGYMSAAYQSASSVLEGETIKLNSLNTKKASSLAEIARLNKSIDEIPANRISKRMQIRAEIEPAIADLTKQITALDSELTKANLQILEVKKKVGPLIYIAKVLNQEIDNVVKYLILIFVSVFDPLAICLVIATSEAFQSRRRYKENPAAFATGPEPVPVPTPVAQPVQAPEMPVDGEVIQMRFVDDPNKNAV